MENNFIFKNEDLFEQILDKYYFLIIFKNNIKANSKDSWYLGEPFYRKYTFSIDLDSRTIGFYLEQEGNYRQINNIKSNNKIDKKNLDNMNKNNNNKNSMNNNILKYLIEIIIIIVIAFIAYYIGVTIREKRKKRANELKDENYEYIPEYNKDINEINNNIHKKEKLVELNSKLGL